MAIVHATPCVRIRLLKPPISYHIIVFETPGGSGKLYKTLHPINGDSMLIYSTQCNLPPLRNLLDYVRREFVCRPNIEPPLIVVLRS